MDLDFIGVMIREHPYLMAVISFFLAIVTDVVWAKWSQATNPHTPAPMAAANWSALMYLFGIVYTLVIMEKNILQASVYVVGAWVGTYLAVKHTKQKNDKSSTL